MTDGTPMRVVVADDEPDVVFLLRIQLEQAGIDVVGTAGNGAQAVEQCRSTQPDAVVMDLLMPEMNGFEAIDAIRRELPRTGVVAYTAVAGQFVRKEMERLGVPLVLKSGDPSPLIEALRRSTNSAPRS